MHTNKLILSAALFLTVLGSFTLAADNFADDTKTDDSKTIEQATVDFYTSLNALFTGDLNPMTDVWSHADDVTYLGPSGGFQVGWEQVKTYWEKQAQRKLGGKIEPQDVHAIVGNDLAFVQCFEQGDNFDAQGNPVQVSIRATNVFRKENGEWKMISHHTDVLPFLKEQSLTKSAE